MPGFWPSTGFYGDIPKYGLQGSARTFLIPGAPKLWFDASDIDLDNNNTLTDGDPIGTWKNKGTLGGAADLVQATASNRPVYRLPSSDVVPFKTVSFDGSDDFLQSAGFTAITQPVKVLIVFRPHGAPTSGNVMVLYTGDDTSHRIEGRLDTADLDVGQYAGVESTASNSGEDAPYNKLSKWLAIFDGNSSRGRFNDTAYTLDVLGNHSIDGLTLGTYVNLSGWVDGDIAEFILWDDGTSDDDIEHYIDTKYRATWAKGPPGEPMVWFDGADIDLDNNNTLTDGDPIGTWKNKGSLGAAADVTQAIAADKPLYRASGKTGVLTSPGIEFDGSGDFLQSADFTSQGEGIKVAMVRSLGDAADINYQIDGNDATNRHVILHANRDANIHMFNGATVDTTLDAVSNQASKLIAHFDNANSYLHLNGTQGPVIDISGATRVFDAISVYGSYTGGDTTLGHVWELLVWKIDGTEPSDAEIESYIDKKYGSTWPKS